MPTPTPENNPTLDVIAVGAHPDDVEIGCGGTVAELVRQGHRVGIVDLTDGEPTPASPGPETRLAEAAAAAEVLGAVERVTLELPNRRLFDSFEARVELAMEFRRLRPRLVIGLAGRTPTASPDHWQAMQIIDAAVFYSRLTKWDEHFAGKEPHRVDALLHYSLGFNPAAPATEPGQVVVDISASLDKKLASIRCYATQFPPEKEYIYDRVESLAKHLGHTAGYGAGELLTNPRPFGTSDLMGQLFPGG